MALRPLSGHPIVVINGLSGPYPAIRSLLNVALRPLSGHPIVDNSGPQALIRPSDR